MAETSSRALQRFRMVLWVLVAVAAIGAAFGYELLPVKADTTVTAVTGFDKKFCFVDKSHGVYG